MKFKKGRKRKTNVSDKNTKLALPIILVSKMYQLVLVKYWLKITKVEIWVNRYLTDITNTNQYINFRARSNPNI